MVLHTLREPVVLAPMAGGPSTPDLAAAVSAAGGLGFLAGGYLPPDALRSQIHAGRARTPAPFGVNLFVPDSSPVDERAIAAYAERLRPEAARLGVDPGTPSGGDDHWLDKVGLLLSERVPVVSFVFGLPPGEVIDALHTAGVTVLVTVTTPEEARRAAT